MGGWAKEGLPLDRKMDRKCQDGFPLRKTDQRSKFFHLPLEWVGEGQLNKEVIEV